MTRQVLKRSYPATMLAVLLTFFLAGQALAYQFDQPYAAGLHPAQSWAPYTGRLQADGRISGGRRITEPLAQSVKWNQTAINWMRSTGGSLSIAFHSSYNGYTGPNGGCDNGWAPMNWAATNMPGGSYTEYYRSCYYQWLSEVRVFGDRTRLAANTSYWAQSRFGDYAVTSDPRVQINVDTYWNSSENYHQKYCIGDNATTAGSC